MRKPTISWVLWLTWRYLKARTQTHGGATLKLAIFSISIGVAVLISVLSGMNGLQDLPISSLREITSYHLQIISQDEEVSPELLSFLSQHSKIINVTPYLEAPMLLAPNRQEPRVVFVRAVDPRSFTRDQGLKNLLRFFAPPLPIGEYQIGGFHANEMWIGLGLAYKLHSSAGDLLEVFTMGGEGVKLEPIHSQFLVSTVYQAPNPSVEDNYAFIPLAAENRHLFSGLSFFYGIKTRPGSNENKIKADIQAFLAERQLEGYQIKTSYESNKAFFDALRTEKSVLQFVVSLIFLVVAFQIYQTIKRSVLQKSPELMLLRAIGASPREVRQIFLLEGLLTGLLGCLIGLALGLLLSLNLNQILQYISLYVLRVPALLPQLSMTVKKLDLFLICGSALVFSTLAGSLASKHLSKLNPTDVLRNE